MDIKRYRRTSRVAFFIGAMLACFGLGLYLMDMTGAGIGLLIAGVVVLVLAFTFTKFFLLLSIRNPPTGK